MLMKRILNHLLDLLYREWISLRLAVMESEMAHSDYEYFTKGKRT